MQKILIKCTGFIGDILFASSIAKKLKEQNKECTVDYSIPVSQPLELLYNNPYIDNVFLDSNINEADYERVICYPYSRSIYYSSETVSTSCWDRRCR